MNRVAIIGGCRTPFVRAGGVLAQHSFLDLGVHVVNGLIDRLSVKPSEIDEVAFSTVLLDPRTPNAARELVMRSVLDKRTPAHFVSNNCISGLVAVTFIADGIRSGRLQMGIAGGSESMSRPTLTFKRRAEEIFIRLSRARTAGERLKLLTKFRPGLLIPQPPSPKEPSTGLTMGEHCEIMAKEFRPSREMQDKLAYRSHQSAAAAKKAGYLAAEIVAVGDVSEDNIVRSDTSVERLGKLKPVFDRSPTGTLTAGNSSALTDGASVVLLASEKAARARGGSVLGYVEDVEYSAIDPNDGLLMAPALAVPRLLHRNKLSVSEIDVFEIHEAFAAQVLCNQAVWETGWAKYPEITPIGAIPHEKINPQGGSIALGHPFAATGGRLLLSLLGELHRTGKKRGVISVCAAGAMGCAMLVKRQ